MRYAALLAGLLLSQPWAVAQERDGEKRVPPNVLVRLMAEKDETPDDVVRQHISLYPRGGMTNFEGRDIRGDLFTYYYPNRKAKTVDGSFTFDLRIRKPAETTFATIQNVVDEITARAPSGSKVVIYLYRSDR